MIFYCPSSEWKGNVKEKFLFVKISYFGFEIFQTFFFKYYGSLLERVFYKGFNISTNVFALREKSYM